MTIPVQSSEVVEFTPDSLKNIENPPVFRLRAPDERHMRRFRAICGDEGLENFSDEEFMAEKKKAISELWAPEDGQPLLERLSTISETVKQKLDLSDDDRKWVIEFDDLLFENWKPLRVMRRKSNEFERYTRVFMISTMVLGWQNIDVPFERDAGYLKAECVDKLAKALGKLDKEAQPDAELSGMSLMELTLACYKQSRLIEDEEKNSPAPLPNSSDETESTTNLLAVGASSEEIGADKTTGSSSPQSKTLKSEASESNSDGQKTT